MTRLPMPRRTHRTSPARSVASRLAAGALACTVALAAAPLGAQVDATRPTVKPRTMYEDLQMFSGVLNQIRVNHPDSVDTHRLIMAAIEGMMRAQDPHSYFISSFRIDPEREKLYRAGKLYDVPIDWVDYNGAFVVATAVPGTAASRQDILPGDELVAVEGAPIAAESAFELAMQLSGPRNSTVKLTFERMRADGSTATITHDVKRERFEDESAVPTAFMLDAQTGYVRIATFADTKVADDLHDALGRLERQGMKRLVLDVRNNGGGSVDEATRIAGEFLPKGTVLYTSKFKKKVEGIPDTARVERSFFSREKRYPIVLLVNNNSASASELLAGALQDHDRALIVGRTTFGKSLVMSPFLLPDGSIYFMVTGQLATPCGRVIQRSYRGVRTRDYFRTAGRDRETAGRPSCRTTGGRTVYGGGGVFPDVVLDRPEPAPAWVSRMLEASLPLKWVGGHLGANAAAYTTADALAAKPELPAGALADFRKFAAGHGVTIPEGEDADRRLTRYLLRRVAYSKWGTAGEYRVDAVLDPEVTAGAAAFDKAAAILAAGEQ